MARLRSPRTTVFKLLENARHPIFIINSDREFVFANQACGTWIGSTPDELIGVKAQYHTGLSEKSLQNRASALCPPPDLFSGVQRFAALPIQPQGASSSAVVRFLVLSESNPQGTTDNNTVTGIVGIVNLDAIDDANASESAAEHPGASARQLHFKLQRLASVVPDDLNRDLGMGQGAWVAQVNQQIQIAASCESNVLISGKTGSGRIELAENIHTMIRQRHELSGASTWLSQLIPIDCPLLEPQSLQQTITETIEQVRSFNRQSTPCFLLKDVDQLDTNSQVELSGLIKLPCLHFRLLAISERNKHSLIESDDFDTDLARELGPLEIALPPLTDRREDISLLAQMYLEEHNSGSGKQLAGLTTEALDELTAYHWPGNVRQLEQFVQESCASATGDFITIGDLPKQIRYAVDAAACPEVEIEKINLDAFLAKIETELIDRAIRQSKGNKTRAAELLGITRARLHRRLEDRD